MIARAIALLFALASPALGVPVAVTSGEHDGFTRIVLNFGTAIDWEFGRVLDGYRFRPVGVAAEYDLQAVYKRIGKSRLAAISADPTTQTLDIGFGCACHAIPFEFRPGIIVIDLRDGPPPKGSSFENDFPDQDAQNVPDTVSPPPPLMPTYDWLAATQNRVATDGAPNVATLAPLPSLQPNLQPLRDQLLRQLSRGASEGVIDLTLPNRDVPRAPKQNLPTARVALGELGGIQSQTVRTAQQPLGAQGVQCVANESLALHDWGNDQDAATLLNLDMVSLVGEFDAPQGDAITRAIRARLFLGFGLEARQLIEAFPSAAENEPILLSLSYVVDLYPDPTAAFQGQAKCNTAAALWGSLSDQTVDASSQVNSQAVVLAFSALPAHLRAHLGPALVDRFIGWQDLSTATSLQTIMARTDLTDGAGQVAQAKLDLAKGDPVGAEKKLDDVSGGVNLANVEAVIERVAARIAQGLPVDDETVALIEAMEGEVKGAAIGEKLAVAKLHAQAASGNFADAFEQLIELPNEAPILWQLLANLANDSELLFHAVPAPADSIPGLAPETAKQIAQRILDLGLPEPANSWAALGGHTKGVLPGEIALARYDARAALDALADEQDPQSIELKAKAFSMLGDHQSAARTLAALSMDQQYTALAQDQDWPSLAEGRQSIWQPLAQIVAKPDPISDQQIDTFGPLARGLSLAEQSSSVRSEINQLLSAFSDE